MPTEPLTRRRALALLLAAAPAALLTHGCGGGSGCGAAGGCGQPGNGPADSTRYVALGDSYAYGYTTRAGTPAGYGLDTGYVPAFVAHLDAPGGRAQVLNLAVPGETTDSFDRAAGTPPASAYNRNYAGADPPSQAALFARAAAAPPGSGGTLIVTLQLGGNDLLDVLADPAFLLAGSAGRRARLDAAFALLETNYAAVLQKVRAAAPNARLFLLGYPDPFAGLGGGNPLAGYSTPAVQRLNAIVSGRAADAGATYVDVFAPFVGHEAQYTFINTQDPPGSGIPDFHPNSAGYAAIAAQLNASSRA